MLALMVLMLGAGVLHAQTQLKSVVIGFGGGNTTSAAGKISLTVQPVVGMTSSSNARIRLGFWETFIQMFVSDVLVLPSYQNQLFQNAPNPFNPMTTIRFTLAEKAQTRIEVFDLRGRRVATLMDETTAPGEHLVVFQPENLASGVYLLRLQSGSYVATKRILLLK